MDYQDIIWYFSDQYKQYFKYHFYLRNTKDLVKLLSTVPAFNILDYEVQRFMHCTSFSYLFKIHQSHYCLENVNKDLVRFFHKFWLLIGSNECEKYDVAILIKYLCWRYTRGFRSSIPNDLVEIDHKFMEKEQVDYRYVFKIFEHVRHASYCYIFHNNNISQ